MKYIFEEIPATSKSLSRRKKVLGVATNDATYMVCHTVSGKKHTCPFYIRWHRMIQRCYSKQYLINHPTYTGCSVAPEWLLFSEFKRWMATKDWDGKDLDKDIITQGNKIYSPEKCLFVSHYVNSILTNRSRGRGHYMLGVTFDSRVKGFISYCRVPGGRVYLGKFKTEIEAHEAYKKYKYKLISDIALQQSEPLKSAMLNYVIPEY